jgi:ribose transport system permease protein/rhamnose transport system permease protein
LIKADVASLKMPKIKKIINYQTVLFIVLIALIALFGFMEEGIMLQPKVLFGLTANIVEIGLMALPMTFIIITGGIDLSVGSIMALSGIMLGWVYQMTGNIVLAFFASVITGIACGMFNGLIIAKTKIPALVTTLATYSLYYGIAKIISGTNIFSTFPDGFSVLANKKWLDTVPYQLLIFIFVFIIFMVAYRKTVIGVYLRGIGLNEAAIKFAGINTSKVKFYIYTLSGLICAIASIIYLSRLPAAKADMGLNLNLEAITAVVLGGTSINGGKGSVLGMFISIFILGVLRKGLQLIGMGGDVYNFVLGLVLVICLIGFSITENLGKSQNV